MINNKRHLNIIDYCAVITCNSKEDKDQPLLLYLIHNSRLPQENRFFKNPFYHSCWYISFGESKDWAVLTAS